MSGGGSPAARSPQMLDTSMSHLGFRCVVHPLGERIQSVIPGRVAPGSLTPRRSQVGSRAGARTVGAGGNPIAFAMDRSPATMVTFPAPATSNAACGFPALRFPVCFVPGVMGPIVPGVLSAQLHDEPDSR